jgi:hypothetical protein
VLDSNLAAVPTQGWRELAGTLGLSG